MKDMWSTLFMAVLTVAVPFFTAYVVAFINKLSTRLEADTKSLKEKELIEDIAKSVERAVKVVNQTYVDNLKANDIFTESAQVEALKKAIDACLKTIKPETLQYLKETYNDVETFLKHLIESEVHKQKIDRIDTNKKDTDKKDDKKDTDKADTDKKDDKKDTDKTDIDKKDDKKDTDKTDIDKKDDKKDTDKKDTDKKDTDKTDTDKTDTDKKTDTTHNGGGIPYKVIDGIPTIDVPLKDIPLE